MSNDLKNPQHEFPHVAYFTWTDPDSGENEEIYYAHDFDTLDYDTEARQKETELAKHGIISFRWCWEDILSRLIEQSEERLVILPSPDELRDMLSDLVKHHDCEYGMTWSNIDYVIDEWKSKQPVASI